MKAKIRSWLSGEPIRVREVPVVIVQAGASVGLWSAGEEVGAAAAAVGAVLAAVFGETARSRVTPADEPLIPTDILDELLTDPETEAELDADPTGKDDDGKVVR